MSLELGSSEAASNKPKLPSFNELISDFDLNRHKKRMSLENVYQFQKINQNEHSKFHQNRKHQSISASTSIKTGGGNSMRNEVGLKKSFVFPQPDFQIGHPPPPSQHYMNHGPSATLGSIDIRGEQQSNFSNFQFSMRQSRSSIISTNSTNSEFSEPRHSKDSSLNTIETFDSPTQPLSKSENDSNAVSEDINILREIEKLLLSSRMVLTMTKDIERDLLQHLSDGEMGSSNSIQACYLLREVDSYINQNSLDHFLQNTPLDVLTKAIAETEIMRRSLKQWEMHKSKRKASAVMNNLANDYDSQLKIKRKSFDDTLQRRNSKLGLTQIPQTQPEAVKSKNKETIFISVNQNLLEKLDLSSSSPTGKKTSCNVVRSKPKLKSKQLGLNKDLSSTKKMVCMQCGETDTPEWRRGPYGVRSLCNACGLFHGKLIKKIGVEQAANVMLQRRKNGQGCDRRIPNGDGF